ncbi:MAG: Unknown protein [uncultured Sulfurovum sp.]|uniref:Uncharacterized protein n=1 Tax=uncultured Sulfurovum sp. TaxID=269237 RepID=A0A6S6TQQ6_9BACT|nr:MAG: Unknown protein [uncultured Sulfurovum sp.]
MTIGVSELQKNISIIRNLKETLQVVDKKTNTLLATIVPNNNKNDVEDDWVERLGGVFSDSKLPEKYNGDVDAAIADAYHQEMMKKYGHMNDG